MDDAVTVRMIELFSVADGNAGNTKSLQCQCCLSSLVVGVSKSKIKISVAKWCKSHEMRTNISGGESNKTPPYLFSDSFKIKALYRSKLCTRFPIPDS